jgi:hypothetical protein
MHAISITRYDRPGAMSVTGCSVPVWPRAVPGLSAVGGVNFVGIAARTTPLPGCLLPAVMGVAGKGYVAGCRRLRGR